MARSNVIFTQTYNIHATEFIEGAAFQMLSNYAVQGGVFVEGNSKISINQSSTGEVQCYSIDEYSS